MKLAGAILRSAFSSWVTVVFIAYVALSGFQKFAIFPIEAKLLPLYSQYASLIYLPHAVRVLATAIYGPKTFFVLFPAILLESIVLYPAIDGAVTLASLLLMLIGAACAPIAYVILKQVGQMFVPGFDVGREILRWRYVFAGGIIASGINSIGLTAMFFGFSDIDATALVLARFFLGDIVGLLVGLVVLTWVFRILRGVRESAT